VQNLDHGSRLHAVTAFVSTELAPLALEKHDDTMSLEHTRHFQ
jgi:hypothetical protein